MTKPKKPPKVYALLPGDPVVGHWHGVQFLTDGQLAEYRRSHRAEETAKIVLLTDPELENKYWLCTDWQVLSTSEVLERFARGAAVVGYTGPHKTASDAHDCADAAWEAPG